MTAADVLVETLLDWGVEVATLDRFGKIDALLTDEQWRADTELELHDARRLTIQAVESLRKSKSSVVFMSGCAALDPKPAFAAVAAVNAAITALAKVSPSKASKTKSRSTALSQDR